MSDSESFGVRGIAWLALGRTILAYKGDEEKDDAAYSRVEKQH